jgi:phosphoglycolate phosphatase-like HAD superfamily hydrolase
MSDVVIDRTADYEAAHKAAKEFIGGVTWGQQFCIPSMEEVERSLAAAWIHGYMAGRADERTTPRRRDAQ